MDDLKEAAKPLNTKLLESIDKGIGKINQYKEEQQNGDKEFRKLWFSHKEPENKKTNIMLLIAIAAIFLNTTPDSLFGRIIYHVKSYVMSLV